ncbi:MAG: hypothetical protein LBF38_09750 [Deltaproteobacteria bacterium]|jgi:uncharacterized membrane protein|nr:hypothetical protein [Deltaproteobacteria bacterium]
MEKGENETLWLIAFRLKTSFELMSILVAIGDKIKSAWVWRLGEKRLEKTALKNHWGGTIGEKEKKLGPT